MNRLLTVAALAWVLWVAFAYATAARALPEVRCDRIVQPELRCDPTSLNYNPAPLGCHRT